MKKRKIIATALIFASVWICAAKTSKGNVNDARQSFDAEPVVIPADFEENTHALYENWYLNNYSSFAKDSEVANAKSDPGATDQQIIDRLNSLGTVIDMPFNSIVRSCIERYTKKGRGMVSGLLGLATYYDPIFEQALEEEGLPLELKYLPIIESALQPNAVSRAGATGLWQLMLATGKGYGMEINSVIDERRDPYVSSKKAAKLLKDLYNTYGDWSLVIAAYNCGPGTVNKALRRAGGDPKDHDFWSIYNYLPSETRGYFPMFVAAAYVMNYYKEHGIYPSLPTKPLLTDTIGIPYRVNINQISKVLNIPADEVRLLNPQFRSDVIPGTAKKPYMLVLPQQQIHAYLMSEDKIRGYNRDQYDRRDRAEPGQKPADRAFAEVTADDDDDDNESALVDDLVADEDEIVNDTFISDSATGKSGVKGQRSDNGYHKVVAGESINTIADLYGVDPDDLARWNNLSRKSLRVGQQLRTSAPPTPKMDKKAASSSRSEATASTSRNKDKDPESVRARNQARREKRQQESKNVKDTSSQNVEQAAAPAASSRRNRNNSKTTAATEQPAQQPVQQKKNSKKQNQQAQSQPQKQQQQTVNSKKKQQQQAAAAAEAKKKEKETEEYLRNAAAGKFGKKAQKNAQAALQQQQQTATGKNQKQSKQQQQQAANAKNQKQSKQQQAAAAKQKPQAPAQHVVKSGESLSKIAQKQGTTVEALRKANPGIKGDLIKPDQKINIPTKTPAKAQSKNNQKAAAAQQQKAASKGKGKKK